MEFKTKLENELNNITKFNKNGSWIRIAMHMAGRLNISIEEGLKIVNAFYEGVLYEFISTGNLKLPYGMLVLPESKVKQHIKDKFECRVASAGLNDWVFLNDKPFVLMKPTIVTAIMSLYIQDLLKMENITSEDLQNMVFKK